jgi:hypothetical protein
MHKIPRVLCSEIPAFARTMEDEDRRVSAAGKRDGPDGPRRDPKPRVGAVRERPNYDPPYRRTRLTSTGTSTNASSLRASGASEGSSVAACPASITVRPSDSARRSSW